MKQTFKTETSTTHFDLLIYDEGGEVEAIKDGSDLYSELLEVLEEALTDMDEGDALEIGNEYRDRQGDELLQELDEYTINDLLEDMTPYEILQSASDIDIDDRYIYRDAWGDIGTTDDVYCGLRVSEVAEWIADNEPRVIHGTDAGDIMDEYNEALDLLNDLEEELEGDDIEEARREEYARAIKVFSRVTTKAYKDADALQLAQITAFINATLYGTDNEI